MEDTLDWYAQDDDGNVWYFGEDVTNYEYDDDGNLIGTNSDGSWEAGLDLSGTGTPAVPGILMPANPVVGAVFYQEYYASVAEDMAQVMETGLSVTIPDFPVFEGCIRTLEWNPLHADDVAYKIYAPGVGLILEEPANVDEPTLLVDTSL